MQQTFWDKYKVFILGLIGAAAIAVQPFVLNTTEEIKWQAVGTAAGLAVLSFIAKEWRGQGMTIIGIIGVSADTIYNLIDSGTFSWQRAILSVIIAIAFAAMPDPKSRGYENSSTIKEAKREGETIQPAKLTSKPK